MAIQSIAPAPVGIIEVPSASTLGVVYVVSRRGDYIACTCPGFVHRGCCKHLVFAPTREDVAQIVDPLPCTGCRNYHLTDADRIAAHPDENRNLLRDGGAAHLAVKRMADEWPS
jgi:hypothetical protein